MKTNRLISRDHAQQLDLDARIRLERGLTDGEHQKAAPLVLPNGWQFDDYVQHSPWRRYMFQFLGNLAGCTVLDLGCGYHPTSIFFALAGADRVFACDVSPRALRHIQNQAEQFHVQHKVVPVACAGERLSIPDASVDRIHGESVLHHLDLDGARSEILRVLRPGGRAAFKDPLGQNPLLEFARDYLPYGWKAAAKGTDRPLRFADVERFGRPFRAHQYRSFGLLSMFAVVLWGRNDSKAVRVTHRIDERLLTAVPSFRRWCRFVVTCVEK